MIGNSLVQSGPADALKETRERTLALVAGLTDEQLAHVVTPLLSPLIWDLGHIANFEQRWLLGDDAVDGELAALYDPFKQPRAARGKLPVLPAEQCFEYMAAVRERVDAMRGELEPFRLELVLQHEQQHNETMLQLLRMIDDYRPSPGLRRDDAPAPAAPTPAETWIEFPAGAYRVGSTRPAAGEFFYDNECDEHTVELIGFELAGQPVLNGQYRQWVEAGGPVEPPLGWLLQDGEWFETGFGDPRPLDDLAPVVHVNWFEADAYARAHGARLPSEFEWEVAASYDRSAGAAGSRRCHAWGDGQWLPELANLDQLAFGPRACAAAAGAPADMAGQVWEWTASEFAAYPGFAPFAYERYSAPFFGGGYRVLRGGSWATRPRSVDNRFRNWDRPDRKQIFAGFRLARATGSSQSKIL